METDTITNVCSHCDRAIPFSNIDLHYAHCSRNLERCKICGDMVPIKLADEHYSNTHAPVECSLCSETMEREILAKHRGENCSQRIVTCDFCEFPLPAIDLAEHQEVCGNRTELCHLCHRYIRLRERYNHEISCNGIGDTSVASSRNERSAERAERDPVPRRHQPPPEYSRKRLLVTIAITGIAVLLGSFFFQRKPEGSQVVLDNGIIEVTISKPEGSVTGIKYHDVENLLLVGNNVTDRGYWDVVWSIPGQAKGPKRTKGSLDRLEGTNFTVITENEEQVEISFTREYDPSLKYTILPLNIDKRFIMLRDSSGFYTYAIYEHKEDFPAFELDNTRVVFKLNEDLFRNMAISDTRQRRMPLNKDREPPRGERLAYPEAVRLVDPVEPEFKGEVDDKYEYSIESKDNVVHGWMSSEPSIGFWQINPSNEFRSAGPLKQFIASHVGPTNLAVFHSTHYIGIDLIVKIGQGEYWKKVYGPIFYYINSQPSSALLWEDAKKQSTSESEKWPYDFPASEDFTKSNQRGSVSGKLQVRNISNDHTEVSAASGAYVGLAAPGNVGSWQFESKRYQFWTKANADGSFSIPNVVPGDYNIYGFLHGFIGDYQYHTVISVKEGENKNLGEIVYDPPRNGSTIWEIGIPDRTAAEFYIPDPNPKYINKLYINDKANKFRQYGLWERYAELYPDSDLVFTVGVSKYADDWYYAQNTRKKDNNTYEGTTWQIKFALDKVHEGTYTLMLSLATANAATLEVRINDPKSSPLFSTGQIGHDNTIARHGIHGIYRLYAVNIPSIQLLEGENTIFLTQTEDKSPFQGIMYDYIRLELPSN
ncbi:hypothetical protein ACFE04_004489 [Oxalis oulophora]